MKVCAISDLHGRLIDTPPCDLLLIAGDVGPWYGGVYTVRHQAEWFNTKFRKWCIKQPAKTICACFGNHDWVGVKDTHLLQSDIRCKFLTDDFTIVDGFKIYGTPNSIHFCSWAFNFSEEELAHKWQMIPDDIHILISHAPPFGFGDTILQSPSMQDTHLGSPSLAERIKQLSNLKLHVWGHIHSGDHTPNFLDNGATLQNVSVLDEAYEIYSYYEIPTFNLSLENNLHL